MSLTAFQQSLKDAIIQKKGSYPYIIHPLLDGIPDIYPQILNEVITAFEKQIEPYKPFDKIVTIEAMGIPLASILSYKLNIPFTIIRKRSYGLTSEHIVEQNTGYSNGKLHINGIYKDDSIILVDDLISTGGTLEAVIKKLQELQVNIKAAIVAVDKGNSVETISKHVQIPIISLTKIEIQNDTITIKK